MTDNTQQARAASIPDAAIEAAAKAAYESTMEDGDTPWEHFGGSSYLDYYRDHARAALEAAAPFIAGDARDRVVAFLEECGGDYDLRYSASIRKLAEDLVNEVTNG